MNNIILLPIEQLKCHEAISSKRFKSLLGKIKKDGYIKNPVVVEKNYFIILDGHHRVAVLKELGATRVPVYLVDYESESIRVVLRRKNLMRNLTKSKVIRVGLSNRVFPQKTTKHFIGNRPKNINIGLDDLFIK